MNHSSLSSLARLGRGIRSCRVSSYDHTGGNVDRCPITSGETITIAELKGAGAIRHIWMTTQEQNHNLKALVLRMYWDGESTPSVDCPIGDFFGLGHGKGNYFSSLPLQTSYLAMNCWFSMPYLHGATMTVTNENPNLDSFLYFYIDYHEYANPSMVEGLGRFHASWHRELVLKKDEVQGPNRNGDVQRLNSTGEENYVVLETEGKGHFVGCVLHLDTNETGWWGEGDDMFFIDGEPWPPRLHGTGMEDYFCGAWNYNNLSKVDNTPYYGYHFKGNQDYTGKHSQYRFHVEDPVYFEKSLLFTMEHGHANDRQGDWNSTAYWYQIDRKKPLPVLKGFEERIPYGFGSFEGFGGKDRKELPL